MKLSTKIAAGFTGIITIMIGLGGIAVYNMAAIKTESVKLAEEYVPEVAVANEVERDSLLTMYNIRGYTMTQDKSYLEKGQKSLGDVQESLKKAEELSLKAKSLVALKGQVEKAKEGVKAYETLLNESIKNFDEIADIRTKLNTSAGEFAENTASFEKSQSEQMRKDIADKAPVEKLLERATKADLITQVIEIGGGIRLSVWKAQALNDVKQLDKVDSHFEEMAKIVVAIRAVTHLEADIKRLELVSDAASQYHAAIKEYLGVSAKQVEINKARGEAADNVLAAARTTSSKGIENTSEIASAAATSLGRSLWVIVAGLIIAIFIGVVLAITITMSIAGPLKRAIDAMKSSTGQIGAAANELSSASQQLSSGASEQASSIEETSASLEEMGGMVQNNVTNAQKAKDLAAQVKTISEQGNDSMEKLQSSMKEILESNQQIEQLVKVIGEIGEKTKVMDEIVFQTKLLSFNASVEAERAGEHGRGFAVVAQEVGLLAQMSGKSAQEIAQIVTSSIRQAETITTENKKKVETGNSYVLETSKYLKEIMTSAATVTEGAQQVVAASQEQAAGIKQINLAMSNLDKATQENSAMAEETASTSEELTAQTSTLNSLVGDLVQLVDGGNAASINQEYAQHDSGSHRPKLRSVSSGSKDTSVRNKKPTKPMGTPSRFESAKKVAGSDVVGGDNNEWDKI